MSKEQLNVLFFASVIISFVSEISQAKRTLEIEKIKYIEGSTIFSINYKDRNVLNSL